MRRLRLSLPKGKSWVPGATGLCASTVSYTISPLSLTSLKTPLNDVAETFKLLGKILWYDHKWTYFISTCTFQWYDFAIFFFSLFYKMRFGFFLLPLGSKNFWLVCRMTFRVYNLLVADIMKTKLFYISYTSKYADLKALLENSDLRSYPLVDSEGN